MYIYIYISVHVYTYTHTYVYTFVHVNVDIPKGKRVKEDACSGARLCIHIYIHIYTCI